jgi:hypothetical protein
MKTGKGLKEVKFVTIDDYEYTKHKKKPTPSTNKVNVKSTRFWKDVYDREGDNLPKTMR